MRKITGFSPVAIIAVFSVLVLVLVRFGQNHRIDTCVLGDAGARVRGVIPAQLEHAYVDARRIQFGLGSAAIGGWASLGDGLVTGGKAWLRTTHPASPRYYSLVANRYFQTNFLAYVPPGVPPVKILRLEPGTRAGQLWKTLAARYPNGVMLEGYARMQPLHTIAIAQPAIDGKSIHRHSPEYYTQPMETWSDTWLYVVGYARDPARPSGHEPGTTGIARLDAESPSTTYGLTHVLLLNDAPSDAARVPVPASTNVANIGQLVGDSVFIEGELRLYPMHHAAACVEALVQP